MLVLLVVAFPLASWYYLNTGLNFRKQALKDLTPKGQLVTEDKAFLDLIDHKTAIIYRDINLNDDMAIIHDQYKESESFSIVQITENLSRNLSTWLHYKMDQNTQDSLFNNEKAVILLDTTSLIRYVYNVDNFQPGRLVEHISILLPRAQEPDIKVRKNAGK
jgi:hypothetical protein